MTFLITILILAANYLIITTAVDIFLMGALSLRFSTDCGVKEFLITDENRIDIQTDFQCSAFSSAYVMRHWKTEASGSSLYRIMPNKMENGYVYPKGIKNLLRKYGFKVTYCRGNLNALKKEISRGNPVIVLIKVRTDKSWLHYVPVVGYDQNNIYFAESLPELVNCTDEFYNRKVDSREFLKLWNTAMIRQPLYKNTFFKIEPLDSDEKD